MQGKFFKIGDPNYNYPVLFFVEGQDDAILLDTVLDRLKADVSLARIVICEGVPGFDRHIPLLMKSPAYTSTIRSINLIRDADQDFNRATAQVHRLYRKNNLPTPNVGEFVVVENRKFGLYLFPRPGENGDLESLALQIVDENIILEKAREYLDHAVAQEPRLTKISKRLMQCYLAGISADLRPTVGWAFKYGNIPVNLDAIPEFVSFVQVALDV